MAMNRRPLPRIEIDADIRASHTLPARVYSDPGHYAIQQERVFAKSWQVAADSARVKAPGHVLPFTLLEGCLDEPLVITSDENAELRCLSNVCTHRGALVVEKEDGPGSPWYEVTDVATGQRGWVHGNVIKITYRK